LITLWVRFRRVCFVVDRRAQGEQTAREFSTPKVINGKTFVDILTARCTPRRGYAHFMSARSKGW
jgi:type I site-specific restriction endonuclease